MTKYIWFGIHIHAKVPIVQDIAKSQLKGWDTTNSSWRNVLCIILIYRLIWKLVGMWSIGKLQQSPMALMTDENLFTSEALKFKVWLEFYSISYCIVNSFVYTPYCNCFTVKI